MNFTIQANTEDLQRAVAEYLRFSKRDLEVTLQKQGAKFAFFLSKALAELAPKRGSIRTSRLAALRGGIGVTVRPKIRQRIYEKYGVRTRISDRKLIFGKRGVTTNTKGLNPQALAVKAELNARESAIGFLSVSARYPKIAIGKGVTSVKSKYGPPISHSELALSGDHGSLTFKWGSDGEMSEKAAEGLSTEEAGAKISDALKRTTKDIMEYVNRKKKENATKARL